MGSAFRVRPGDAVRRRVLTKCLRVLELEMEAVARELESLGGVDADVVAANELLFHPKLVVAPPTAVRLARMLGSVSGCA